ncbi:MAG: glutathione S-transferase family protein [Candidatus Binatia bacterium]
MTQLRIFSYLPNPRIWKATIAARLCRVEIEVRGASPKELQSWLWDFDARPLSSEEEAGSADVQVGQTGFKGVKLRKTEAFLEAHPFGTVPAAFSPDGKVGIFESNSIMRAVARLGERAFPLYGHGPYEASRVDSFLDASLVFARDAQTYLLSLLGEAPTPEIQSRARDALSGYLAAIDRTLLPDRKFLVGDDVTLADICFVAELGLFFNERTRIRALEERGLAPILDPLLNDSEFACAADAFTRLGKHPAFAPDVQPYLEKIEATAGQGVR